MWNILTFYLNVMHRKKCKLQFIIYSAHEQDGLERYTENGISENWMHQIGNEQIVWGVSPSWPLLLCQREIYVN
jgi:hypothetical protein